MRARVSRHCWCFGREDKARAQTESIAGHPLKPQKGLNGSPADIKSKTNNGLNYCVEQVGETCLKDVTVNVGCCASADPLIELVFWPVESAVVAEANVPVTWMVCPT